MPPPGTLLQWPAKTPTVLETTEGPLSLGFSSTNLFHGPQNLHGVFIHRRVHHFALVSNSGSAFGDTFFLKDLLDALGPLNVFGRRCVDLVGRLDLAGMNEHSALIAHLPAFPGALFITFHILKSDKRTVDRHTPRSPGGNGGMK